MSEYLLSDRVRSGTDIMQRIVGGDRSALIELSDEIAVLETKLEDTESDRIQLLSLMEDAQIQLQEIADKLLGVLGAQGESDEKN